MVKVKSRPQTVCDENRSGKHNPLVVGSNPTRPTNTMTSELERILQQLHGEYVFDSCVLEHHRSWWAENAYNYLVVYLRVYARFEPEVVEFVFEEFCRASRRDH